MRSNRRAEVADRNPWLSPSILLTLALRALHRAIQGIEYAWLGAQRDIETHVVAPLQARAERTARRKHDVLLQGRLRHVDGVQAVGKLRPEKHAAARLDPGRHAEALQPSDRQSDRLGQTRAQRVDMAPGRPLRQHAMQDARS